MNYYEMLGLPCDGKEADDVKLIKRTLSAWADRKNDMMSNETQEAKKRVIRAELDELPMMQQLLTDAALRKKHAEELKNARLEQVDSIIKIMEKTGTSGKKVAKPRLDSMAKLIGLASGTVVTRFKAAGYTVEVKPPVKTDDFLMEKSLMDKIEDGFRLIREHMARNPYEPKQNLAKVRNLYEYLAVMESETDDASAAREIETKPVVELAARFGQLAALHVKSAAPIQYYKSIENEAKARVMKDDKTREKYNNMLKLQEKDELFRLLASVPNSVKLERTFAEQCIKELHSIGFNDDQALAIYNKFGAIPQDTPYERESTKVFTMCTCHILNEHDTQAEAERAFCSCGKALYETCPKCNKNVPAISDYCSCGFFMKGRQSFALHQVRFNNAIKAQDLPVARDEYSQAKLCDPSNKDLPAMKTALDTLEKVLGNSIEEIKRDLDMKLINAAQKKIVALKAKYPTANVKQYQEQVSQALTSAKNDYDRLQLVRDQGQGVELASMILEKVKDYSPVLEWLRQHPPKPVRSVQHAPNAAALKCVLQWVDDPENRYVSYTVVRKEGAAPLNVQDGVKIASELKTPQCSDTSLEPGRIYVYAVFAVRGDAHSRPVCSQVVCLLQNISEVQVNIAKNVCTLSWRDIPGSRGVHISRSDDGGRSHAVVCQCARGTFNDTNIANNRQYRYTLRTIWEVGSKVLASPDALVKDVRVEKKPPRTDIRLEYVGPDGNCRVSWPADTAGTLRLIALRKGVTVVPDQVYNADMLNSMGDTIVQAVPMTAGQYSWYAEKGRQFHVAAFRNFGDDAVGGQAIRISTVPPVQVDDSKTTLANNTLHLHLANVPEAVTRLFYMVSVNGSVGSEENAMRGAMPSVDMANFRRAGMIAVDSLPPEKLTISVIAMYGSGADAYFSPVTKVEMSNRPKAKIEYWIEWQTVGFARKRKVRAGAKLYVRCESDRIPEMELCCRSDGRMIFNYIPGGDGIVQLMRIDAMETSMSGTSVAFDIPERVMKGLPANTDIQLFLIGKEKNSYAAPMSKDAMSRKMPPE